MKHMGQFPAASLSGNLVLSAQARAPSRGEEAPKEARSAARHEEEGKHSLRKTASVRHSAARGLCAVQ